MASVVAGLLLAIAVAFLLRNTVAMFRTQCLMFDEGGSGSVYMGYCPTESAMSSPKGT